MQAKSVPNAEMLKGETYVWWNEDYCISSTVSQISPFRLDALYLDTVIVPKWVCRWYNVAKTVLVKDSSRTKSSRISKVFLRKNDTCVVNLHQKKKTYTVPLLVSYMGTFLNKCSSGSNPAPEYNKKQLASPIANPHGDVQKKHHNAGLTTWVVA